MWTNLVVLEHPMLRNKFQDHCFSFLVPDGRRLRFVPYMGMVAILVIWPGPFEQTFVSLSLGGSIWNLTFIGQAISEEKMFKSVDDRGLHIILARQWAFGSVELKCHIISIYHRRRGVRNSPTIRCSTTSLYTSFTSYPWLLRKSRRTKKKRTTAPPCTYIKDMPPLPSFIY